MTGGGGFPVGGLPTPRADGVNLYSMKKCSSCCEVKPLSDYYVRKASPDGLGYKCKVCVLTYTKEQHKANPGPRRARALAWQIANPERVAERSRQWRAKNAERRAEVCREWNARNQDKRAAAVARRRARIFTPSWADRAAIADFYKEAKKIEKETGVKHHVDHIVPLNSPLVCGLHVPANLQVIPASQNVLKRNLVWPDMP